jgi:hypothetical protein
MSQPHHEKGGRWAPVIEACRYCAQRQHLRRTLRIALVVGVVLTAINQLDVILSGDATASTWVKCGLNFVVPFVVSNLGLLSGRAGRGEQAP